MGSVAYFVTGKESINSDGVEGLGLGYVLDGSGVSHVHTARGPDGSAGVYFAAGGTVIKPGALEFEQFPGKPGVFIGVSEAVKPEDLARDDQVSGHLVKMGDGAQWEIPVARHWKGAAGFPRRLAWTPDGWKAGDVIPAYKALWRDACSFWTLLLNAEAAEAGEAEDVSFSAEDEVNLAARAIAVNYRVGPAEISHLGLFTTETKAAACLALVDFPSVKALKEDAPPN